MSIQNYEMLRQAIAHHSTAVLALPSSGGVQHRKTRFAGEAGEGFWIETGADADRASVDALIAEKTPVGLVFKSDEQSVMFTAPIKSRDEQFKTSDGNVVGALYMAFPRDFQRQQRRQAYRAPVPPDQVSIRLWRIPDRAVLRDRPLASQELFAKLDDLSVTGVGIHCRPGRDGQPAVVLPNERLRIVLTWGTSELLTEGRLMHRRDLESKETVMGIQFAKLEKDFEGRQTLAKFTELVGYLQREEVKQKRLLAG